jgi:hypothetical protein
VPQTKILYTHNLFTKDPAVIVTALPGQPFNLGITAGKWRAQSSVRSAVANAACNVSTRSTRHSRSSI